MCGKDNPSPKKCLIMEGLKMGKNFSDLVADLSITKATTEVYEIDGLAAGQQIDHETLVRLLDVSMECFKRIRNKILVCEDRKLHKILDNLSQEFFFYFFLLFFKIFLLQVRHTEKKQKLHKINKVIKRKNKNK